MKFADATKLQAILFDADGVVIVPPYRFSAYLEREYGLTMGATQGFFRGVFRECLIGQADLKQEIAPFLPVWGWLGSVDEFLQRWFEEENVVDDRIVPLIHTLREKGIFCGLATNQERYRIEYMKTEMGFATLFDDIFGSADVGAVKPEQAYYREVTERLKLPHHEILFLDDSLGNVEAAQSFGWKAEHYEDFERFQPVVERYFGTL